MNGTPAFGGEQCAYSCVHPYSLIPVIRCWLSRTELADSGGWKDNPLYGMYMKRRTWVVFCAVQLVGCIFASYGTVYSESAFVRSSWLVGFLLLLPGNLPATLLAQKLIHVRTALVFFPVAVGLNAIVWIALSSAIRTKDSEVAASDGKMPDQKAAWPIFVWCLPALGGFVMFLLSFPIDRQIPFWPRLSFAEIFTMWFLFVAPIATIIAAVALIRRRRSAHIATFTRVLAWTTIAVSVLVNAFVLVGMWAATY